MSVFINSDYTEANGFLPLTHARILHKGVWQSGATITASGSDGDTLPELADNALTEDRWRPDALPATLSFDFGGAQDVDCLCIGAHTLSGYNVAVEYLDGTWAEVMNRDIPDNSAIMFLFDTVSAQEWRITITDVTGGGLPEIGNIKWGQALQMQRAFYGGASPARMNRATEVLGNISRTGGLLGRSIKRTILQEGYRWENLTYAWVRANLDGPSGLIQSVETQPCYVAWRPALTGDCAYVMRATTQPPSAKGASDLWSFAMDAEVYSYE